ncbi:restriction endonuclease subunit S [Undibacterium sp. MH2W]|uniref:restriction endonuclease subunit S n=1 Tax=Undibacterium sp. MH2W TaxID=3413044 RepID=UPI003BF090C8
MPKIDLKNLDKSDWKTYRFDQIVKNVSERVEPAETELEIYIGLEHIDAESIHIKRFGKPSDVEGQKLKCYPGDVIFGKRRAYQRKASVVTTEAICSAHAFVLRANPEVIDPKLLPFFLHSDLFMHRAVDISAGGLSPTINWGVLKIQDFLLPLKEQQTELAELLWAMDEVVEKDLAVLEKLVQVKHSERNKIFFGYDRDLLTKEKNLDDGIEIISLADCCEIANNLRKPINKEERQKLKGDYPYYGPTSIIDYISEYRIEGKYVLIGEDGDHFLKYATWYMTQYATGKFNVNNHAHILKGTDRCLTKWLYYTFQHRNIIPYLTKQGATRYKLNKDSLSNIPIIVPPVERQIEYIKIFDGIEKSLSTIDSRICASKALQKSLINEVF